MTMPHREMSDREVCDQIERADAFREGLRDAISEAIAAVNPHSPCADASRRGLARIAETLDQVDNILISNLSNIDAALKRRTGTGLLSLAKVRLMSVGGGPELDFADAASFLARFEPMIAAVMKRKIS